MDNPGLELTSTIEAITGGATGRAIEDALQRIATHDAQVQAWTYIAPRAPEQVADLTGRPLSGVPFAVKDVIDVADMPTCCGSEAEPTEPRAFDASCVALLRQAGAVPLGKVVTAEYAFRAPGPTRNPRAPGHTPGGSSSGSAAAVAAGMVPFALGTQTGGSIIRPAAYCGVVGFKPSFGGVFRDGLRLTCESLDVIGWHTRSVVDSRALARILLPYQDVGAAEPKRPTTVAIVAGGSDQGLEAEGLRALEAARGVLARHGVRCIDVPFAQGRQFAEMHSTIMQYEFARSLSPVTHLHANLVSAGLLDTVRCGFKIPAGQYLEQRHAQAHWRAKWDELFGDADVVLTPSAPGAAPVGMANTGTSAFNRIWSALGWPCVHLPLAPGSSGLPIGVQLVGPFESDHALLAWAQALHRDMLLRH